MVAFQFQLFDEHCELSSSVKTCDPAYRFGGGMSLAQDSSAPTSQPRNTAGKPGEDAGNLSDFFADPAARLPTCRGAIFLSVVGCLRQPCILIFVTNGNFQTVFVV